MNIERMYEAYDHASDRYNRSLLDIEHMRRSVQDAREGKIKLTDIPQNEGRIKKRLAREGLNQYDKALERINGIADFQDICIVRKITRLGEAVCRVEIPMPYGSTAYGTGFLISPDLIITNHHVLENKEAAAGATVKFRYELDERSRPSEDVTFRLRPDRFFVTSDIDKQANDPHSGLDFTIVAVDAVSLEGVPLSEFKHVPLDGSQGKILEGENCVVIQHPQGDYKKIVLKDIRLLTIQDDFIVYESDTQPGSSGSMVVGLGTGEIVGLHHSGVPRKDANGNWLRKDGTPVEETDSDDVIDWLGNEGIRVSSILRAIAGIPVERHMEDVRRGLVQLHSMPEEAAPKESARVTLNTTASAPTSKPQAMEQPKNTTAANTTEQHYDIVISAQPGMLESWEDNKDELIPNLVSCERLLPFSTDPQLRRHYYITIKGNLDPWKQAAAFESLPQIEKCIPDLPSKTYIDTPEERPRAAQESLFGGSDSDEDNWKRFTTDWRDSFWCKKPIADNKPDLYRAWNWTAINAVNIHTIAGFDAIRGNLKRMRLIQLDTGYTTHSKNTNGYDFERDYDTVNEDSDASDLYSTRPGRMPGHGTRTASLVVGSKLSVDPKKCDGNRGILTVGDAPLIRLIPYRVANSVILVGAGRDMVEGARRAVNNNADVIFMCMGSYPRPMLEAVAKDVYDKGVIWVCAAGNQVKVVVAPAIYPGTVAVAAVNPDFRPWSGSCRGPEVDVAAPGEDVYVPTFDGKKETMRFGSGTSYATPHVASAAMLWKAKHLNELGKRYNKPWQIVEAFRYCLQASVQKFDSRWSQWERENYGAGLLDINKLLATPLPAAATLKYAYENVDISPSWDLGVTEAVAKIWDALSLTVSGAEASVSQQPLTERAQLALGAITGTTVSRHAAEAAVTALPESAKQAVLETYFNSFSNPVKYDMK